MFQETSRRQSKRQSKRRKHNVEDLLHELVIHGAKPPIQGKRKSRDPRGIPDEEIQLQHMLWDGNTH